MCRVLLVDRKRVGYEQVGHPLDGLSSEAELAGDVATVVGPSSIPASTCHRALDWPTGARQVVASRDERAVQLDHADRDAAQCIARGRALRSDRRPRIALATIDRMLSFWYGTTHDSILS